MSLSFFTYIMGISSCFSFPCCVTNNPNVTTSHNPFGQEFVKTQLGGSAPYGRTIGCGHSAKCTPLAARLGWAEQSQGLHSYLSSASELLQRPPAFHVPSVGFLTAWWPQCSWTSCLRLVFKIDHAKLGGRSCQSLLHFQS